MIATIIIIVIVAILVIWLIAGYNRLVKLRNNVKEGFSTMDVYLKKRYDLVPNLVETVKGYATHESSVFEKVTQARSMVSSATGTAEQIQAENALTQTLRSLFAVAENYPDLKANQNFMDLQNQLSGIEQDIANARKYYNGTVKMLNNACETFPSVIIAKMFHFKQMPMYEVADSAERENVKVQF